MKQFILSMIKTIESSYLYRTIKQFILHLVGVSTTTTNPTPRPVQQQQSKHLSNYESYLIIAMTHEGKIDFLYDWKNNSQITAKRYAELLYHLNEGHFSHEIMRHLNGFIEKERNRASFINMIINEWINILQDIKPAVRPLAFFRHGKISNEP